MGCRQMDFVSFKKIPNIRELSMTVTQKLHGSNAQILIEGDEVKVGSRNRWIDIGDDNFGFANFVLSNKQDFIERLGDGRHYGEWCGPGINSGEGLTEKRLLLFNFRRWAGKPLPLQVGIVPLIYHGEVSLLKINEIMDELKRSGSYLSPGFMLPEGIVIEIGNNLYKKTFDSEEVKWCGVVKVKPYKEKISVDHLLQPIRLQKILSREERYSGKFPLTLPDICRDYINDLIDEKQFDPDDQLVRKTISKRVYPFVKTVMLGAA